MICLSFNDLPYQSKLQTMNVEALACNSTLLYVF